MSDRDDIIQPRDHLPPHEERADDDDLDQEQYPDTGGQTPTSAVSPETAAEPDKALRHGVDKLPPTGR